MIEICKMQLSFNDTRYYVSYIYVLNVTFFRFICSNGWELSSIGLNMVVISKHRKLRCCGIMEKILFPFFLHFCYQTKKSGLHFPPVVRIQHNKSNKKGKTLYERLIILIPISIIFSLVEKNKNMKQS